MKQIILHSQYNGKGTHYFNVQNMVIVCHCLYDSFLFGTGKVRIFQNSIHCSIYMAKDSAVIALCSFLLF